MLGEFQAGLLDDAEQASVQAHVSGCPYCSRELALTQRFMQAPAESTESLQQAPRHGWRTVMGQLLSTLSGSQPAMAVRGQDDGPLMYGAADVQIAMTVEKISAEPTLRSVIGFIAGDTFSAVDFWQGDVLKTSVMIDASGSFVVDQIKAGSYQLLLRSDTMAINIPAIDLS